MARPAAVGEAATTSALGDNAQNSQNSNGAFAQGGTGGNQQFVDGQMEGEGKKIAQPPLELNEFQLAEAARLGVRFENSQMQVEAHHTSQQAQIITEFKQSMDLALVEFIQKAREKMLGGKANYIIGEVDSQTSVEIQQATNVDVDKYNYSIKPDRVAHIDAGHGMNGESDQTMSYTEDMARMGYILENYDGVEILYEKDGNVVRSKDAYNADKSRAQILRFSKVLNGTYYVVVAVQDAKAKCNRVETAYMEPKRTWQLLQTGKNAINEIGTKQVLDGINSPQHTSKNDLASVPANNISYSALGDNAQNSQSGQNNQRAETRAQETQGQTKTELQTASQNFTGSAQDVAVLLREAGIQHNLSDAQLREVAAALSQLQGENALPAGVVADQVAQIVSEAGVRADGAQVEGIVGSWQDAMARSNPKSENNAPRSRVESETLLENLERQTLESDASGLATESEDGTILLSDEDFKNQLSTNPDLKPKYSGKLVARYLQGTETACAVFDKYVPDNSIADSRYQGTAYYNAQSKKIYLTMKLDLADPRGAGTAFFHEHGHLVDNIFSTPLSLQNPQFAAALESDCKNYIAEYQKQHALQTIEEAYTAIGDEIYDAEYSAISDLFGGMTDNKCKGLYGHDVMYWFNPDSLSSEAFAHMFEAQFSKKRFKLMQKYFPKAFKLFLKLLEGLL